MPAAIEAIVFAGAAGFAFVVVLSVVVIIGVRQEERYLTFEDRAAPGIAALLARMVLGRYVRKERRHRAARTPPDDLAEAHENCIGPAS
jgi:hypothetical protein